MTGPQLQPGAGAGRDGGPAGSRGQSRWADLGGPIPADVVAQHVEVARQRAGFAEAGRDFSAAARSVVRLAAHSYAYRRAIGTVGCPVLLLHGERDRLIPVVAARSAARPRPSWSLAGPETPGAHAGPPGRECAP
jgi:pimeloyl-ACP methyl ester carboxylesterase